MKVSTPLDREGFYIMKHEEEREKEIWKDIPGYEGLYQASNYGRIKSFYRGKQKIRKHSFDGRGYPVIHLYVNRGDTTKAIHRIIAKLFVLNPDNKPCVNHKNLNKEDNYYKNLEFCTNLENMRHGVANGAYDNRAKGNRHGMVKLNEFQVRVIRKTKDLTAHELASIFGVTWYAISAIRQRVNWKHVK